IPGTQAVPEAEAAAMMRRAGVYRTYVAGDQKQYLDAVARGVAEAHDEIFKERPIRDLQAAWGQGGMKGATVLLAKAKAVTDTNATLPGYGGKIMNDPRVLAMVDQALDVLSKDDRTVVPARGVGEPAKTPEEQALRDLADTAQNVVY